MRFSLATLVLLVLWIGSLMLVWAKREPWNLSGTREILSFDTVPEFPSSPDQTRTVLWDCNYTGFFVCSKSDKKGFDNYENLLHYTQTNRITGNLFPIRFVDDDTLELRRSPDEDNDKILLVTFHRRFPEWWWGHFYRPEVWLATALSGLLIWRAVKSRRRNFVAQSH